MKLGLGTAQFGFSYGITNTNGQVSLEETASIVRHAHKVGIDLIDTACVYGNSEETLGACLTQGSFQTPFRIVTKTRPLKSDVIESRALENIQQGFTASLRNLRQIHIDSVHVHHADDLLVPGGDRLYALLAEWKADHKIQKIGVSIYHPHQIEALLARYQFDVIQIPLNVFDQRLLANGVLRDMKRRGMEIHARSLFLQGVLLTDPTQLPKALLPLCPLLERFDTMARQHNLTRLEAALSFVQAIPEIDYGIVGVASLDQFKSICKAHAGLATSSDRQKIDFSALRVDDIRLVNPSLW